MFKNGVCMTAFLLACFVFMSEAKAQVSHFTTAKFKCLTPAGVYYLVTVPCNWSHYYGFAERFGCNADGYEYQTVDPPTWPAQNVEAHVLGYWNWCYEGYTRGGGLDFTTNCHGFAFEVPDWPITAEKLIAGTFGGSTVNCWIKEFSNAKIATNVTGHSLKIRVEECPLSIGLRIMESYEKFKESPIYTKMTSCGPEEFDTDIWAGNGDREGLTFDYYRLP